jgi:hypothetical protein
MSRIVTACYNGTPRRVDMRWPTLLLASALLGGCVGGSGDKPGLLDDHDGDDDGYDYADDCNDDNPDIHPDAGEKCDPADVDEDCNGLADNADPAPQGAITVYHDADGDGYGDPGAAVVLCELVAPYVADGTDCDDADARIHPDAAEVCDPLDADEDCDGTADDADDDTTGLLAFYADTDGDGYGDPSDTVSACSAPDGYVADSGDCDDTDPDVSPGQPEHWYDGLDDDCTGGSDYDRDNDGADAIAAGGDDCDDYSHDVNPGADEVWYDGVDEDCSGGSDFDQDGDGFDTADGGGDDCDDTDAAIHPGAWETGTGGDADCDGVVRSTPQAVADYDTTSRLLTCTSLRLDGSGSADPGGLALSYAWALVDEPDGSDDSTDDIDAASDANPVFAPRDAGDYTFQLTVSNSAGVTSYPQLLTVSVSERTTNTAPTANAGADQTTSDSRSCVFSSGSFTCAPCAAPTFTLDGSGSTDPDDEPLSYAWTVSSGTGTLSSSTGVSPTLTLPAVTPTHGSTTTSTVTVHLMTTDCMGATSSTDSVTLTATCTGS